MSEIREAIARARYFGTTAWGVVRDDGQWLG